MRIKNSDLPYYLPLILFFNFIQLFSKKKNKFKRKVHRICNELLRVIFNAYFLLKKTKFQTQ